jgi:hypothetical protein
MPDSAVVLSPDNTQSGRQLGLCSRVPVTDPPSGRYTTRAAPGAGKVLTGVAGEDAGADLGADLGAELGTAPGAEPGADPGAELGANLGAEVGCEPVAETDAEADTEETGVDDTGEDGDDSPEPPPVLRQPAASTIRATVNTGRNQSRRVKAVMCHQP